MQQKSHFRSVSLICDISQQTSVFLIKLSFWKSEIIGKSFTRLPAQAQLDQRVVFRFSTLRLRSKNNIHNFFRILGVGWSQGVNKFKSFQGLLTTVVFHTQPFPPTPHSFCQGWGDWPMNEKMKTMV